MFLLKWLHEDRASFSSQGQRGSQTLVGNKRGISSPQYLNDRKNMKE